jgi:uncharacterized repeat protein (TIGR01451 family)
VLVSTNATQGTVTTNGAGLVTWTVPSLVTNASATLTLVVQASAVGKITNAAVVTTGTTDKNPADDRASAVVNVIAPTADLSLSLAGAPNPVVVGNYVTYTLTISNGGPATAASLTAVNTLPPTVAFVSATPAGYTLTGQTLTFTNLGNLGSGLQTTATIVVWTLATETITDSARCSSSVTDPLKGNNAASVKTIVEPIAMTVSLSISRAGTNVVVSWPVNPWNFSLESAADLRPPVVWTPMTNPPPTVVVVGGQNTVTLPIGSGSEYFRLYLAP